MRIIHPEVLILSNRHDFASDYITTELETRSVPYLRLNVDDLPAMEVFLEPTAPMVFGATQAFQFEIDASTLRSVYFRYPVFLRESSPRVLSADEQMKRSQWAAFMRSFMVFDQAFWMNHPKSTYYAEVKPVQLRVARQVGFNLPHTVVSNSNQFGNYMPNQSSEVVLKSIDTLYVREAQSEAFAYSTVLSNDSLAKEDLSAAPAIFQNFIDPKIDLRVTVVGDQSYCVKIVRDGAGVSGDWRFLKDHVDFVPFQLPKQVTDACIRLSRALNLPFSAIDLAVSHDEYVFIEVNPTGEWAWLVEQAELPIDKAIADALCRGLT